MATDLQMSSSTEEVEFPYRALSRSAIASVCFFVVGLSGLLFQPLLIFALFGLLTGFLALRAIKRYPNEFSGAPLAKAAMSLNVLLLAGGMAMHTYIYFTEVPPGHVRLPFYELKFAAEPDRPTAMAMDVDGKDVFIKGYIHPSSGGGMLRQFVLVGDLGTCCFGGQPKSSEMVVVTLTGGQTIKGGMTRRKLAGEFTVNKSPVKRDDFDNVVFYRLKAKKLK